MTDFAQLVLDEELYLHATQVLAGLETGEERFALPDAARTFVLHDTTAMLFEERTGSDFSSEAKHAVTNYVDGVYVPGHYNLHFEGIATSLDGLDGPAANGVRLVFWAFMTAWTQRFGGVSFDLVVSGTLVDPARRSPQS